MANKDVGRGFGDLPGWLTTWSCPKCLNLSAIQDWAITIVPVGADNLDGRKCPNCDFVVCQVADTHRMLQQDVKAVEVIADRQLTPEQLEDKKLAKEAAKALGKREVKING